MSYRGLERLTELLSKPADAGPVEEVAGGVSSYETTTRQMVRDVEEDVRSLRRRLDALIFMVLSAILAEAATRIFGG